MFCFTNSRGTFYRPGDTMPALKKLLAENKEVEIPVNKNTVYCFDSEAYRFLAAVKNKQPVSFPPSERANFATSWETSLTEVNRMLTHIKSLEPHNIKSTLNLNTTRELVLKLSRPLAEISRNIQMNKALVNQEKEEIENMEENVEELKKRQMKKRMELEARKIDHPKTVCGHSDCKKTWELNGSFVTEYTTECHNPCGLSGIPADTRGDPGLMDCWAINSNGHCRHSNCGHHYQDHLHIYYDSVQVEKDVVDESVVHSIKSNLDAKQMKQNMIEDKNQEISEYEKELQIIESSSVRFAYFLKKNAITPYNDAQLQYLEHLIQEEKDKVARGGNRKTLDYLTVSRASYEKKKDILEKNFEKGGDGSEKPPTLADIDNLIKQLQVLKHSGKILKQALLCVDHAKGVKYQENVVNSSHFSPRKTVKKQGKAKKGFWGLW